MGMKRHHLRILREEMEFSNTEAKSKMKLFHLQLLCHIYKEFNSILIIKRDKTESLAISQSRQCACLTVMVGGNNKTRQLSLGPINDKSLK